jgi:tetratricopeptide (TPR) repeat protein
MPDNSELSRPLPKTVDELADLDWKSFESFATSTIRDYYAQYKVEISPTRWSHDDGRDGEGVYVLASNDKLPGLTLIYSIRLEVKKRSANVTLDDIGKNLVIASNDSVQKLLVVTNRDFAPQVKKEIERFASRHAMSYGLVNGEKLIELALSIRTDPKAAVAPVISTPALEVEFSFSRQPHPIDTKQMSDLVMQHDEPVFLIATVSRSDGGPAADFTLDVTPTDPAVSIVRYSAPEAITLGGGDRANVVFTVIRRKPSAEAKFNVAVSTKDREVKLDAKWHGRCRLGSTLRSRWIPESRWQRLQEWSGEIGQWIKKGGTFSLALVAYPGVGKSVMLNRLRAVWLAAGVRELFLEGGRRTTDADIATLLFEAAFPVDPSLLRGEMLSAVDRWLTDCRIEASRASKIAETLCGHGFRPVDWKSDQLADLCASLVRRIGGKSRFVMVVEDLHFYEPSAIELLTKIHTALATFGDANVAFVCTTRQLAATGDAATRTTWAQQLRDFFDRTAIRRETLDAFTGDEAIEILQRTIPTLETHLARLITHQVGRTPLGLREAVAFFRTENIVWPDPILQSLAADRDRLATTVESEVLKTVTESRIDALKKQHPMWLSDLIDAAACVGRFFRLDDVLPRGWEWNAEQEAALALCEELDVIRAYEEGLWAFDHDKIRTAVVGMLSAGRQQRVAQSLIDAFKERPLILGSLLYQAGRYRNAADTLQVAGDDAMARHRFGDAIRSLMLAVNCVDPATAKRAGTLEGFDVAIVHAEPPKPKEPPTEAVRHRVLDLMTRLLHCTGAAVFASRAAAAYLTEATMLARQLGDDRRLAELLHIRGVRAFERDELGESVQAHQEADALYERLGDAPIARAHNLLRLGITQRQKNEMTAALATMRRAHRMAGTKDLELLIALSLNLGAVYLNDDLAKTARYWHAALRMARRTGNVDRLVHAMVDVGYLELLRGNEDEAALLLSDGYALSCENELENSAMRTASNLACVHLIRGDFARALELLRFAEEVGLRLEIGRRLWRVRANLATAHEACGDLEKSYAADAHVVKALAGGERILLEGRRHSIPFLNVALRARESDLHRQLLDTLESKVKKSVLATLDRVLGDETGGVHEGLSASLKTIGGRRRFIVTE